jgi:hypothetical protein
MRISVPQEGFALTSKPFTRYLHLHCTRLARPRRIAADRAKRSAVQVSLVTRYVFQLAIQIFSIKMTGVGAVQSGMSR